MRKFQQGGLAALVEEDDEEVFDPGAFTGTEEILAEVTPEPKPNLYKMARMNRDQALARLRAGQEEFKIRAERQNKRAEQDRWLAMAQAMLTPTRTGGFGESVGMAAGALREQSGQQAEIEALQAAERQRFSEMEMEVSSDYFDALTNLEGFKNTSRARVVGQKIGILPAHKTMIDQGLMKEADADRVLLSTIMLPTGDTKTTVETIGGVPIEEGGEPYLVVDPAKDPGQAAAQKRATVTADLATKSQFEQAKFGVQLIPTVRRLQQAYGILQGLREDTSGLNEAMRRVAQWAGISEVITDNTKLADLHRMFGDQVLSDLRLLTGTKTDFEYRKMEELNAGLGKSVEENLTIIDSQLGRMGDLIDRGEYAAQGISEGPGTEERDFLLENYLRFRKGQAEAAADFEKQTRVAPQDTVQKLLNTVNGLRGNPDAQNAEIELFREYYDIPAEVALQLRRAGAGI